MLTQMTGSRMIWMVHRAHLNVRVASDKHEEEGGGLIYIYIDIFIHISIMVTSVDFTRPIAF